MKFNDAFDNDCKKICASDELINRTLMAAITHDSKTPDDAVANIAASGTTSRAPSGTASGAASGAPSRAASGNSIHSHKAAGKAVTKPAAGVRSRRHLFKLSAIAAAAVILFIGVYSIYSSQTNKNILNSSTLKVYAGENNEELNTKGLSLAYCKDTADGMSDIQGWDWKGGYNHTRILYFDLNIQLTDSSSRISRITVTASDDNVSLLTREPVPEDIIANNYEISDEYGEQHSLYKSSPDFGYRTYTNFSSKDKFLYINHNNEYSAAYEDFEHLYAGFRMANTNSLNSKLTITAEYEDGTIVSRNYSATAYSSEYYMFIKEIN